MAPLLFNIYTYDLPTTISRKYAHADDLAIMHADGDWRQWKGCWARTWQRLWIHPDFRTKAQHYKNGFGSLPSQQQGSEAWAESQLQQRNPALLLRAQIPRSNVGQVALVSPTHWVTLQEADITCCVPEVAWWLRLGCKNNNSANSHPSPGAFNRRVVHACLVPQCSYHPSTTPCELRLVACILHQQTTFPSSQVSNLLSFITMEPHGL